MTTEQSIAPGYGEHGSYDETEFELILGNSNKNFSGVTSTMLQTIGFQQQQMSLRVLGRHHLPDPSLAIGFLKLARIARTPLSTGRYRVFHARRNDEMIQALILRDLLGAKIKIVFTSTAQRRHTGFTRGLMSRMDAVLSTCEAAARYLEQTPAAIIPHGVNPQVYFPAESRSAQWQQTGLPGRYGIGIFGRVREQKGIGLFVDACIEQLPNHPDFTAVIVGAINARNLEFVTTQKGKIAAAGLGKRIRFLGEQDFEKIPGMFRAMSLIAALSYNEGYGLTVPEALSSGVAVLATDAGAWPEIVEPGVHGQIVPAGNESLISSALGKLLSEPGALEQMGKNGRTHVLNNYHVEQEAEALCRFYRSLVDRVS